MSVVHFENDELEALWGAIDPKDTSVAVTLYVLGNANRAAYLCSYPDTGSVDRVTIELPRTSRDGSVPGGWNTATAWLDNLLYNCISNGGTDFAAGVKNLDELKKAARRADAARAGTA